MKKPDTPDNEVGRINSLHELKILDTPAEERFDRWTRIARRIFDVPIVLVSLVDEDRQWFKSTVGLNASETPRDIAFCGHAILQDQTFVVDDTIKDERFADNPLVTGDPNIRFYAGCPLSSLDGSKLGTLCLIDTKPRQFSKDDDKILKDLADSVERELAATELATTDHLTRLSNRRGFTILAQKGLDFCSRLGAPASLVYFDLNDFKLVNDTFGHAEGDRPLSTFADQLLKAFRKSDVIGRLGGDEFAVLLTNCSELDTHAIDKKLTKALTEINQRASRGYDITFSSGVVSVISGGDYSIENLLKRADELMYEAKLKKPDVKTTTG